MQELREYFATAILPPTITPRPHLHICDPKKFVATQLERMECESPRLRRLAISNLKALKNLLESH